MARFTAITALGAWLLAATLVVAVRPVCGAQDPPAAPDALLYDTGTQSAEPLTAAALKLKSGWTAVPEDDLTHRAEGDLIVQNDRLVIVLRGQGTGAEVYAQTNSGPKLRAVLSVLGTSDAQPARTASVRIVENNPGAVAVTATSAPQGRGARSLTYRLTAGQMIIELRPGEGIEKVVVGGEARYVVIPDFFGDDMVFPAELLSRPRLRLPAENFFLNLSGQGGAQVMCVWPSRRQAAVAVRSPAGRPAAIAACEIEAAKGKSVWVAVLDSADLWHAQAVSADDAQLETALRWKPPFPAKWRADLLSGSGPARSWYFHAPDEPHDPAGDRQPPCCLEGDVAVLRLRRDAATSPSSWRYPSPLVVYALDRSRATPLTTFCPIDVLRNTLGVGPCQYILQTEGLGSDANPTPDYVMTWVEKQFKRKKDASAADEMRELLDQMVEHIGRAQARIEQYGRLGRDVRRLCSAGQPEQRASASVGALSRLAERLEQAAAATAGDSAPSARAAKLAAGIIGLVGKPGALAECERLGVEVRRIGASQDRALSDCRMMARWLKQSALMAAEDDPQQATRATDVAARAEQALNSR